MLNKILCITPIKHIPDAYDLLLGCGDVLYHPYANKSQSLDIIRQESPQILFVNPNKMKFCLDEEILSNGVKVICTASTGLNHIDIDFCSKNNIIVLSLTKRFDIIDKISSTAEMALTLMLSLARNIVPAIESVRDGEWDYEPFLGTQISGKTIGIIGYGRLGKMMARYCRGLGMDVKLCDPYVNEIDHIALNNLVSECDFVSLHVHLNSETRYMINKSNLQLFKAGCYLINTSRGDIVNEIDIIESLDTGRLRGYATDVISDELGDINSSPLLQRQDLNILITPHLGGSTLDAQTIAYTASILELKRVLC